MSDTQNVPDFLRDQFALAHVKPDRVIDDVNSLKLRMSALESETACIRVSLAELNSRVDRLESRLDSIERRLDLADT